MSVHIIKMTFSDLIKNRRLLLDIFIRGVLSLLFTISASQYFRNALHQFQELDFSHPNIKTFSQALSLLAIGSYMFMLACLWILRLKPVNKFAGIWPSIAAFLGSFIIMGLVWIKPCYTLPPAVEIMASCLILLGNILGVITLVHLGRSFSILPEGRRLVKTGPYQYVRHPLYLAEAFGVLGSLIVFFSPLAVILVFVQTVFQLIRMHYEERVLSETFPEYSDYVRQTARLIPGIY